MLSLSCMTSISYRPKIDLSQHTHIVGRQTACLISIDCIFASKGELRTQY
jgi:hypothetical protein